MSEEGGSPAERALSALLERLGQGALHFEGERLTCVTASPRAAELLGVPRETLLAKPRTDILAAIGAADDLTTRALESLRAVGPGESRRETVTIGTPSDRELEWITAPAESGRIDLLIDRTTERALRQEIARLQARIAETTLIDELTGLSNRRHFEAETDREHRRSQRAWASYAIARIDVDGMAKINTDLGRDTGDKLLRRIGEELRAARREYDLVARWEGDELIVLLPGIDASAVRAVLARSLGAMRDAGQAITGREVTFCAGVALWIPPSVEAASDIVSRSGTALEAAKLSGAGTVEIDDSMVDWRDDTGAGHI